MVGHGRSVQPPGGCALRGHDPLSGEAEFSFPPTHFVAGRTVGIKYFVPCYAHTARQSRCAFVSYTQYIDRNEESNPGEPPQAPPSR